MRLMTGPRLVLLPTLTLAFACASPKSADAPQSAQAPPAGAARAEANDEAPPPSAQPEEAAAESEKKTREDQAADGQPRAASPIGGSNNHLEISVPMINGGLNRDIIRRTASDHSDEILGCYGRALAAMPELAGTLVVALKIDDHGDVSEAELSKSSQLTSPEVEDCVLGLARGWQFERPSKAKQADFELAFEFGAE
jgi:outer membrane biosynthesis protein TonB